MNKNRVAMTVTLFYAQSDFGQFAFLSLRTSFR